MRMAMPSQCFFKVWLAGSGPSEVTLVQVRFLSWAIFSNDKPNQKLRYLLMVSSAAHKRLNSSVIVPNN